MIYTQPAETNSTDTLIKHADIVLATPESAGLRDADTCLRTLTHTHAHIYTDTHYERHATEGFPKLTGI